jgi:[acyl-carrier-protein] S-malonyltransferase
VLALVAPGQGAQTPGFLAPWLEIPAVADRMAWWSTVTGLDLARYGTEADAEEIRDTAVAQPLLVSAALASVLCVFPHPADAFRQVGVAAGHSVGEISALAGTNVVSAESALVLVRERGRAMAEASAVTATGMTAVLGGDPDEVLAAIEKHGLTAANRNGAGQIVAAGTLEQLEAFAADPPAKARLRPLSVAGAFHTEHMRPAVDRLGSLGRAISVRDPRTRLVSNADGMVIHDGHDALVRIVRQVANPVRWDLCMQTMGDLGVTGVLEVPPAGTLVGLVKRALPGVETFALKTPDDLRDAREFVSSHAMASPLDTSPTWRLLVSPLSGTFRRGDAEAGDSLTEGSAIGGVVARGEEHEVLAPHGGTVIEWLAEDGDPVSPGQPLVRLHPDGAE